MDFLPIPDSCKERQWEVPFLDALPYDGQGFLGFLERSNMSERAVIEAFSEPSSEANAHNPAAFSFVQQWLFFGVLHEIYQFIDVPFVLDDFKRQTGDGRWLVTTAHVPDLISTAYESRLREYRQLLTDSEVHDSNHSDLASLPGHELRTVIEALNSLQLLSGAEQSIKRLATVRKTATDVLRRLEHLFHDFRSTYDELVSPIMVSVECLLELLNTVSNKFIPKSQWPEYYYRSPVEKNVYKWRYYYEDHLDKGHWCRNRLDRILNKTGSHALKYITSLLPSFEHQTHTFCKFHQCVVKRGVNHTIPHHDPKGCAGTCHSFDVDMSQLNLMIQSKTLPLVVKTNDGSFAVVAESLDCEYTAITHVWTHGLGNSQRNALPLCQMQRIFDFVQKMEPSRQARVWIDTLCVPASGDYKTQAIAMLRDIYTRASEVLLIDSRLCRVSGSDAYENAIQFLCSEWLSRLWTFQEGYLARKLVVQLADSAISQETLVQDIKSHRSYDWFGLSHKLAFFLALETEYKTSWRNSSVSLSDWVLLKLQCRSTTVPADEAICLANILDISNTDSTTLPSMEMIYRNLPISSNLLFLCGAKLKTSGFRWAPATFLNSTSKPRPVKREVASLQKEGLLVKQCGMLLDDTLSLRKDTEVIYWKLSLKSGDGPLKSQTQENPERLLQEQNTYVLAGPDNTSFQLRKRQICHPAIILDTSFEHSLLPGVLVSRVKKAGGTWVCEFEMTLDVWRPGQRGYGRTRELCETLDEFSDPIPCLGRHVENVQWLVD